MISTPSEASSTAENAFSSASGFSGADQSNGGTGGAAPAAAAPEAAAGAENFARSNEQANSQADPYAQRLREHEAGQRLQWQEQVNKWRKEATEDPQIGGANLPATVARAQLALDRFDESKCIGQLLEQTGYGNNPDVLRFFNRLADALMEDGLVQGQAGGSMPPLEERMYAGWSSRSGSI
ncbi:hypothetical protein [uncultured Desulfovibrio sp.]|uniref:hypothetical protein n=1 Tax=uncultured Desulfovibrio sp. TaxID=167968 RepID=UPI00262355B7|nr:hypothetical protein [uncultured Desulfovibrio sp.]